MINSKNILVTGATGVLGEEFCKIIIENSDLHLIALDRKKKELEKLDDFAKKHGRKITLVEQDLLEFEKIDVLGASIYERFGKLSYFVSMAQIATNLMPLPHFTPKTWQKIMDVNFTVNWRLIRSLDALLNVEKNSKACFVVNARAENEAFYGPFAASNAALDSLISSYAGESEGKNVEIQKFETGRLPNHIGHTFWPGLEESEFASPIAEAERLWQNLFK